MPYSRKHDLVAILDSFGLPSTVGGLSQLQWMDVLDVLFPMMDSELAKALLAFAPSGLPDDVLDILKMST